MEYTKGEWVVVGKKSTAYSGYHIWDNTQGIIGKDVAIIYPNPQGKPDSYGEANARLIAAAPDIYEALKLTTAWAEEQLALQGYPGKAPFVIKAQQALAKAEGR